MALPSLITQTQFENRAGMAVSTLTGVKLAQFTAFAEDASALIRDEAGLDFVDEADQLAVPAGILPVAFRVVHRAMENPLGHASQTDGTFTWRKEVGAGAAGVYLTDEDADDINAALAEPATGFTAVSMSNFDLPVVT